MVIYPVPQPLRPAPRPPVVQLAVFLPAAPPPAVELPPLVMAPIIPAGWPRF